MDGRIQTLLSEDQDKSLPQLELSKRSDREEHELPVQHRDGDQVQGDGNHQDTRSDHDIGDQSGKPGFSHVHNFLSEISVVDVLLDVSQSSYVKRGVGQRAMDEGETKYAHDGVNEPDNNHILVICPTFLELVSRVVDNTSGYIHFHEEKD